MVATTVIFWQNDLYQATKTQSRSDSWSGGEGEDIICIFVLFQTQFSLPSVSKQLFLFFLLHAVLYVTSPIQQL